MSATTTFRPLRVIVSARATTMRLSLSGDIDLVNRLILEEAIEAAATCGGNTVDLDLTEVTSLDGDAINSIVASGKRLGASRVNLTISNIPPAAREAIRRSPHAEALIANGHRDRDVENHADLVVEPR